MQASFEDSNIELFGSALELQIKRASAMCESAFDGVGTLSGLTKWRVKNFVLERQSLQDIATFFDGDSYVVLITAADASCPNVFDRKIFYWLGTTTTADEAGTAAYKTIELGERFNREASHHREVAHHESDEFMAYFEVYGGMRILNGGYDSGFRHVNEELVHPRLLQIKGRRSAKITQVPLKCSSLRTGDVFVLDAGTALYQFNGEGASIAERVRAAQFVRSLCNERNIKCSLVVLEQANKYDADMAKMLAYLGGTAADIQGEATPDDSVTAFALRIWRKCASAGFVPQPDILHYPQLDSTQIYVCDTNVAVYLWIGAAAGADSRSAHSAFNFASAFLQEQGRHANTPITVVYETGCSSALQTLKLLFE